MPRPKDLREQMEAAFVESFNPDDQIINLGEASWMQLVGEDHKPLPGIIGKAGAKGNAKVGGETVEIGADMVSMEPGSAFDTHVHKGAHILHFTEGRGMVHINGTDRKVDQGDTIFIPALYAHGVKTYQDADSDLTFVAFGVPHMPVESADRMWTVEDE